MFDVVAKKIIDQNIQVFQEKIKRACQRSHDRECFPKTDFPIFFPANKAFFEYQHLEKILESYIRDYIITPTLCQLFHYKGYAVLKWVDRNKTDHIQHSYSNEEFAKYHPIAIEIEDEEGITTGICYSEPYYGERKYHRFIRDRRLFRVEIIDWNDGLHGQNSRDGDIWSYKYKSKIIPEVLYISLYNFFVKYFSDSTYFYFLRRIRSAVEAANKEIGFDTIPNCTIKYLSDFKPSVLFDITVMPMDRKEYYYFDDNGIPRNRVLGYLVYKDYQKIVERLDNNKLIYALIGNEKFAKCFLTAEYLFQFLTKGNECSFDYTSIATGYFKSIELLLEKIVQLALECKGHEKLWIKRKINVKKKESGENDYKGKKVRFIREHEEEFSIEMKPLIWFLYDRIDGWYISETGRKTVYNWLSNYTQSCRNGYFHKEIIDKPIVIRMIRNNTILCLLTLLGGCKLTDYPEEDYKYMGVTEEELKIDGSNIR